MIKKSKLVPDKILKEYMTPSIFQEFTLLAKANNSVNLGQGFPNWSIPKFLEQSLSEVFTNSTKSSNFFYGNSYLLNTLTKEYSSVFNRELSVNKNFVICNGGASILTLVCASLSPQDEVIVIEPYFNFYEPMLRFFRANIKFISMDVHDNCFTLNMDKIKNQISKKTKWIWMNSPHNPTGKVFTEAEYLELGNILDQFPNVKVLSDEVYEHIAFGHTHMVHLANVKGFWNKTVSVYSGGKTFSCTGWRIGWAVGPDDIIDSIKAAKYCTVKGPSSQLQEAIGLSIEKAYDPYQNYPNYYSYLKNIFSENTKILSSALNESVLDFEVINPEGGYFLTAAIDKSILKMPVKYLFKTENQTQEGLDIFLKSIEEYKDFPNADYSPDEAFCRFLTIEYGVTPLPLYCFYYCRGLSVREYPVVNLIRFSLCKTRETFIQAYQKLTNKEYE